MQTASDKAFSGVFADEGAGQYVFVLGSEETGHFGLPWGKWSLATLKNTQFILRKKKTCLIHF